MEIYGFMQLTEKLLSCILQSYEIFYGIICSANILKKTIHAQKNIRSLSPSYCGDFTPLGLKKLPVINSGRSKLI